MSTPPPDIPLDDPDPTAQTPRERRAEARKAQIAALRAGQREAAASNRAKRLEEKAQTAQEAREAAKEAETSLVPTDNPAAPTQLPPRPATQLAQIVNLRLAGYSPLDIGKAIGATEAEVERLLVEQTSAYIKTQPALRMYARDWISREYMGLIEANRNAATDPAHPAKLENQDRMLRALNQLAKLHGAEAPAQSEVKVETAPEAVEKLVQALSKQQGYAFDDTVFDGVFDDVVDGELIEAADAQLEVSGNLVEESDGGDAL